MDHAGRRAIASRSILRQGPFEDVRLIVVTDNERILGLGDQGAGGMAIPIGKLALYTAACGIHPSLTLPVSLDVGTDNPALLADPLYLGLSRAAAARRRVRRARRGVRRPASRRSGRAASSSSRTSSSTTRCASSTATGTACPSFNDDIQGTAAVVVAGVLAALRATGRTLADARVVLVGAGAAGIGIARLLRLAMLDAGVRTRSSATRSRSSTRRGSSTPVGRTSSAKAELAVPAVDGRRDARPARDRSARGGRTILVGTTGVAGTFAEAVIRGDGRARHPDDAADRPAAVQSRRRSPRPPRPTSSPGPAAGPWSRPARRSSRWSVDGRGHEIGQANNAFIFPGVGLGAIVAEARTMTDRMFLLAARDAGRRRSPTSGWRRGRCTRRSRRCGRVARIAIAVAAEAVARVVGSGRARRIRLEADVDAAMWWPDYVPYTPGQRRRAAPAEPRRDGGERRSVPRSSRRSASRP